MASAALPAAALAVAALTFNAFSWGVSWWPFRQLEAQGLHALWATAMIYGLAVLVLSVARPAAWGELLRTPSLWVLVLASGTTNASFNWAVTIGANTVALGTDWYASGSDSLFDELRLAGLLLSQGVVTGVEPDELPPMVLEAPAKILDGHLGTLLPGAPADLVVIPWKGSLATSLENADVDTVVLVTVAGKPLFGKIPILEVLLHKVFRSPVRPETHAYGFALSQVWDQVKSRFPDAVSPEPLKEKVYPRLQHP